MGAAHPISPARTALQGIVQAAMLVWVVLFAAPVVRAEYPQIQFTPPACVPAEGNALVEATVTPSEGWSSIRAYFLRHGRSELYFLEMRPAGNDRLWAVLPKPDQDTPAVDLRIAVRDGEGRETRSPVAVVPVLRDCPVALTDEQRAVARNLIVGETLPEQFGGGVLGFLCDGIVLRMNFRGELRPEDCCCENAALLAQAKGRNALLPLVILGGVGGGTSIVGGGGGGEVSKARP